MYNSLLKIFRNAVCVYVLILLLVYLLRKRVCINTRNFNNKCCIVAREIQILQGPETY